MQDQTLPSDYLPNLCRMPVVLAVLLLTQLLVVIYVLSKNPINQFDWQQLSLLSLYSQWISLLTLALLCSLRPWVNRFSTALATVSCFAVVVAVVLVSNLFAQWVDSGRSLGQWSLQWLLRDLIIFLVLAGIALRYLYIGQQWRREQAASNAAELDALYARIRPHFLFNAMNTIAGLIGYAPDDAEKAVEDLSLLMRASMAGSNRLSRWDDELAISVAYCRIEQQRLGERLTLDWQVDAIAANCPLPPLVLQPLLENAIYHGIEKCTHGGVVALSAEITRDGREQQLRVTIRNPLPDAAADTLESNARHNSRNDSRHDSRHNGIALDNIRARLARLYRDPVTGENRASLHAEQADGSYTVCLSLPVDFVPEEAS